MVVEDVHGAFNGELGAGGCKHVGVAAERAREEKNISVAVGRDGQRPEEVDAYGDDGVIRESHRVDEPANRVAGAKLALEAVVRAPLSADTHPNPP